MNARLFLGRETDGETDFRLKPDRLRTHGVVVGMTGSGKTGLSLVMLEELASAGVPIIAVDPKGDLGNLGLLLGNLDEQSFAPWVAEGDPKAIADRWKSGLERWGLGTEQVSALRDQLELTVYTPGSESGVPVDLLGAFRRPTQATLEDDEARRDLVADTISGLLGLAGKTPDPMKDPSHIVLSRILDEAWMAGEDPDLEALILRLVNPPFKKVGVFPVDKFFPPDARMDLAMVFNGIVASPSFEPWSTGRTLDLDQMLETSGKTKVHVFSVAHLDETERRFFVSLLLGQTLAWSRRQPGTEALRAVLFFDEVAGYLPPHPKNPPTKGPLLTMMKQARAVGLGVVLATQNPVDLDYKALSNAGFWAIGRLSTAQDRERLLKGIEGQGLDEKVASLEKRQFLIHQVGRGAPSVIASRHAMCYLRGPFTKVEIGKLNTFLGVEAAKPAATDSRPTGSPAPAAPSASQVDDGLLPVAPSVTGADSWFLDPRTVFAARLDDAFAAHAKPARPDGKIEYQPAALIDLRLRFDEDRLGFVLDQQTQRVFFPLGDSMPQSSIAVALEADDLMTSPEGAAAFATLPSWADERKEWTRLKKDIVNDVYRTETKGMFVNKPLKLYSKAEESRADFDARAEEAAEDLADAAIAKLKDKYETKIDRLDDRIEKKMMQKVELEGVAKSRQLESAVSIGATIFSMFTKKRATGIRGAASSGTRAAAATKRVGRIDAEIKKLEDDRDELRDELVFEVDEIRDEFAAKVRETEDREVRLEKNDIDVQRFGILWIPVTRRV